MLDKAQNSNEAEDQNNDSSIEFLGGIDALPKRDQQFAPQSTRYDPFSNQYLRAISKLIDNKTSLTNVVK